MKTKETRGAKAKGPREIEWVGARVELSGSVTEGGKTFQPAAIAWYIPALEHVVGLEVGMSTDPLSHAVDAFWKATKTPMVGAAHAPTRVRVASEELAEQMRAALGSKATVVCAATPELDAVFASVNKQIQEAAAASKTFLAKGITPEAMGSFFGTAARLFRANPWSKGGSPARFISVAIDALGVDGVLAVVPASDAELGRPTIMYYTEPADLDLLLEEGLDAELPVDDVPHVALQFLREGDVAPERLDELRARGWEIAAPDAIPLALASDGLVSERAPAPDELEEIEAVAAALAEIASADDETQKALAAALEGGAPFEVTRTVSTHAGARDVTLRAPYVPGTVADDGNTFELLEALYEDGDADDEDIGELEDELVGQFERSPEGSPLGETKYVDLLLAFAVSETVGKTIGTLDPDDLRQIVFTLVPRHAGIPKEQASVVIAELRAFYAFLEREVGFEDAPAFLEVLGGDAVSRLELALGQRDAAPKRAALSAAEERAKKNKRKAARKSKRKNR